MIRDQKGKNNNFKLLNELATTGRMLYKCIIKYRNAVTSWIHKHCYRFDFFYCSFYAKLFNFITSSASINIFLDANGWPYNHKISFPISKTK